MSQLFRPGLVAWALIASGCGGSSDTSETTTGPSTESVVTGTESESESEPESGTTAEPEVSEICEQSCDHLEACLDDYSAHKCKVGWELRVKDETATDNCGPFIDNLCGCYTALTCEAINTTVTACEDESYLVTSACDAVCYGLSELDSDVSGACSSKFWCPVGLIEISCDGQICTCNFSGEPAGGCEQQNACGNIDPEMLWDHVAILEFAQGCCDLPDLMTN